MLGDGGTVTVMSVMQAPREFLEALVTEEWRPFDTEESQQPPLTDDNEVQRYVDERGTRLVAPVIAALITRGIEPQTAFVEANDAAAAIVEVAESIGADVIIMGATRQLFTESAWTSISMQVTAASKLPVLLIPAPSKQASEADHDYGDAEK